MLSFNCFSNQKYNEYLIIAHGLFGSKKNWTNTAKFLSENLNLEVIVVDLSLIHISEPRDLSTSRMPSSA